jgi:hypothetical protein
MVRRTADPSGSPDFLSRLVASQSSCGFPYRKPHTLPSPVPLAGNPGTLGMTKGRGDASMKSGGWTEGVFITLGGPKGHDSSVEKHFQGWSRKCGSPFAPDEQNGFPRKHLILGGGNCRFLGFARNDKGESSALIGCGGGNNCLWMPFIPLATCRRQARVLLRTQCNCLVRNNPTHFLAV